MTRIKAAGQPRSPKRKNPGRLPRGQGTTPGLSGSFRPGLCTGRPGNDIPCILGDVPLKPAPPAFVLCSSLSWGCPPRTARLQPGQDTDHCALWSPCWRHFPKQASSANPCNSARPEKLALGRSAGLTRRCPCTPALRPGLGSHTCGSPGAPPTLGEGTLFTSPPPWPGEMTPAVCIPAFGQQLCPEPRARGREKSSC